MPEVLLNTGTRAIVLLRAGETLRVKRFTPKHLGNLDWVKQEGRKNLTATKHDILLSVERLRYNRTSGKLYNVWGVFFLRKTRPKKECATAPLLSFAFTLEISPDLVEYLNNHREKYQRLEVRQRVRGMLIYDDEVAVCKRNTDLVWILHKEEYLKICKDIGVSSAT